MVKQNGYNWPENFSTAVTIGVPVDAAKKWTSVLAEDTGMKVHIACTPNTAIRFKWLRYGIVDITIGGIAEVGPMLEGNGHYGNRDTGAFPVGGAWVASKGNSGFFVRGDSHIKTMDDIRPGVRVVDMRSYLGTRRILVAFLAWSGHIKDMETEVVWVPATGSDHKAQLVVDGEADVAFAMPTSPEIYKAEKNPRGLRWIELNAEREPEGARRFREKHSLVNFGPMFNGVPSCIGRWGTVGAGLFCCRADADTESTYQMAKWLDENWTRYKDLHFRLEHITRKNLMVELDTTFIPCHDGLIKYLKELGLWTNAHEERQKANVDLVTRYCVSSQEAMWLADEKRIVVSQDSPEWVDLWENYKKEQGLPAFELLPGLGKG